MAPSGHVAVGKKQKPDQCVCVCVTPKPVVSRLLFSDECSSPHTLIKLSYVDPREDG